MLRRRLIVNGSVCVVGRSARCCVTSPESAARRSAEEVAPAAAVLTPSQRIDHLLRQYHERGVTATYHTIATRAIASSFAHGGAKGFYDSVEVQQATRRAVIELYDTLPPFNDRGLSRVLSFTLAPDPGGAAHDMPDLSTALANDRILLQMMLLGRRHQMPTIHLSLAAANFAGVAAHHMAKMNDQVDDFPGIPPALQKTFFAERVLKGEQVTVDQTKPDVFVRLVLDAWLQKRHDKARDIVDTVSAVHEGNNIFRALATIRRHPERFPSIAPQLLEFATRVASHVDTYAVPLRQSRSLSHEQMRRAIARDTLEVRIEPFPLRQEMQIRANKYLLQVDALRRLTSRLRSAARRAKEDAGENRHFESVHAVEIAKVSEQIRDVCSLYATWAYAAKAAVENEPLRLASAIMLADQLERLKIQVQKASEFMSVLIRVNNVGSGKRLTRGSNVDTSSPSRIVLDMRNKSHGCMSAIHQCRFEVIGKIPFAQRGQVIATVGREEEDEADKVIGHTPSRTGRVDYFVPHTALRILLDSVHEFVVHSNASANVRKAAEQKKVEAKEAVAVAAAAMAQRPGANAADSWDDDAFGDATDSHGSPLGADDVGPEGVPGDSGMPRFDGLPPMYRRNCQHTSPVDDAGLLRSIEALIAQHFPVNNVTATARFNWLRLVANVASDAHFFATIPKGKIISMTLAVELFVRHEASLQQRHARQGMLDSFSFVNGVLEALSRFPHSPETAEVLRRCAHVMFAVVKESSGSGLTLVDHRGSSSGSVQARALSDALMPDGPSVATATEAPPTAVIDGVEAEEADALFEHVSRSVARGTTLDLLRGGNTTETLIGQRHRSDKSRAILRNVTFALSGLARSHVNRRAAVNLRNAVPQQQVDDLIASAKDELERSPDIRSFGLILYAAARLDVPYSHLQSTVRSVVGRASPAPRFYPDGRLIVPGARATPEEAEMVADHSRSWFSLSELCTVVDALNIMKCTDRVVADRLTELHGTRDRSDVYINELAAEQEKLFGDTMRRSARHSIWGAELYSALEHGFDMGSTRVPAGVVHRAQFTRLRRLLRRSIAGRTISFSEAMTNAVGRLADERLYKLTFVRNSVAMPRAQRADDADDGDRDPETPDSKVPLAAAEADTATSTTTGNEPDVDTDKQGRLQLRNRAIIRAREQKRAAAEKAAKTLEGQRHGTPAAAARPSRVVLAASAQQQKRRELPGAREWISPVTKQLKYERWTNLSAQTDSTPRVPSVAAMQQKKAAEPSERAAAFERMMDEEKARKLGLSLAEVEKRNPDAMFAPPTPELVQIDPEAAGTADTSKRRVVARRRRSAVTDDSE